jgi:hypothetical protein
MGCSGSSLAFWHQWGCMNTALICLDPTVRVWSWTASTREPTQRFLDGPQLASRGAQEEPNGFIGKGGVVAPMEPA